MNIPVVLVKKRRHVCLLLEIFVTSESLENYSDECGYRNKFIKLNQCLASYLNLTNIMAEINERNKIGEDNQ